MDVVVVIKETVTQPRKKSPNDLYEQIASS